MTSTQITFHLEGDTLIGVDEETGFPHTIPFTIEGLSLIRHILKEKETVFIEEFLSLRAKEQAEHKQAHKAQQAKELEELF